MNYFFNHVNGRLILSVFLSFIFIVMLLISIKKIEFHEVEPSIQSYEPEEGRKFGDTPPSVEVGIFVRSMPKFDIDNGQFSLIGSIWFYYYPSQISLEDIKKFKIDRGEILQKSEPKSKKVKEKILTVFDVNISFSSELNYRYFPFADHRVFLVVKFPQSTAQEMLLVSGKSNIIFDEDLFPGGWKLVDYATRYGFYSEYLDKNENKKFLANPQIYFSFNFKKPGFRKILIIIIPAFILFLLAMISLLIQNRESNQVSVNLSLAAISGLLVHRFVIENLSPKVGYFIMSDWLYTMFITMSFFSFILNISYEDSKYYWKIRFSSAYLMQIISLFFFYFFVLRG